MRVQIPGEQAIIFEIISCFKVIPLLSFCLDNEVCFNYKFSFLQGNYNPQTLEKQNPSSNKNQYNR